MIRPETPPKQTFTITVDWTNQPEPGDDRSDPAGVALWAETMLQGIGTVNKVNVVEVTGVCDDLRCAGAHVYYAGHRRGTDHGKAMRGHDSEGRSVERYAE